jgi:hypothetical protein
VLEIIVDVGTLGSAQNTGLELRTLAFLSSDRCHFGFDRYAGEMRSLAARVTQGSRTEG